MLFEIPVSFIWNWDEWREKEANIQKYRCLGRINLFGVLFLAADVDFLKLRGITTNLLPMCLSAHESPSYDSYCLFLLSPLCDRDRFPTSKACHLIIDYRLSISLETKNAEECLIFYFPNFFFGLRARVDMSKQKRKIYCYMLSLLIHTHVEFLLSRSLLSA